VLGQEAPCEDVGSVVECGRIADEAGKAASQAREIERKFSN
jgi:hypothetical protein